MRTTCFRPRRFSCVASGHVLLNLRLEITSLEVRARHSLHISSSGWRPFQDRIASSAGLPAMEKPSSTNCLATLANPVSRPRGKAPGALSHMVSANLRARALAPVIREIWAEGYMSYNAVSRELNRRQVPPLRGGKQWYPMTAGRLLERLERTGLIRIRRPSACDSLLRLAFA